MDEREVRRICAATLGMRFEEFGCLMASNLLIISCGSNLTTDQRSELIIALQTGFDRTSTVLGLVRFL